MIDSLFFPPVEQANSRGLLAFDGELDPIWLFDAYTHGIFPWPITGFSRAASMAWWSPNPRAIFSFNRVHVPQRLLRTIKQQRFDVVCDTDFRGVITNCATAQDREDETWITPPMIDAYCELYRLGIAHSVEAYLNDKLVGGVYGVAIHGLFAAESMFYKEPNASKVALIQLLHHLKVRDYRLVDIQMITDNTRRFGAIEIPRTEYMRRLNAALNAKVSFGTELCLIR